MSKMEIIRVVFSGMKNTSHPTVLAWNMPTFCRDEWLKIRVPNFIIYLVGWLSAIYKVSSLTISNPFRHILHMDFSLSFELSSERSSSKWSLADDAWGVEWEELESLSRCSPSNTLWIFILEFRSSSSSLFLKNKNQRTIMYLVN